MKETKSLGIIFICSLGIFLISSMLLILNFNLVFKKISLQIVLSVSILSFLGSIYSLRKFLVEAIYEIDEKKQKEKNIRDCYKYQQLLNPPDTDMNN